MLYEVITIMQATVTTQGLSFFDLAVKGGWIMIPILMLFIVAIYISIERFLAIKKASYEDPGFMNRIKDYILDAKIDSAVNLCKRNNFV